MAIASFLPQPDKHGQLLDLLRSWPHEVLSGISEVAIDSIQSHLSQRPEQPFLDLQRCLALLHQLLVSPGMDIFDELDCSELALKFRNCCSSMLGTGFV
jgi:hypothetical protein